MRSFAGMQRLKRLGLMLVVRHLRTEELEGLRQLFLDIDADGSGSITVDELIVGLDRHGAHMSREEVEALIRVRASASLLRGILFSLAPAPRPALALALILIMSTAL